VFLSSGTKTTEEEAKNAYEAALAGTLRKKEQFREAARKKIAEAQETAEQPREVVEVNPSGPGPTNAAVANANAAVADANAAVANANAAVANANDVVVNCNFSTADVGSSSSTYSDSDFTTLCALLLVEDEVASQAGR
jgi:hypothetical protein